jgi:hypothetical protein
MSKFYFGRAFELKESNFCSEFSGEDEAQRAGLRFKMLY